MAHYLQFANAERLGDSKDRFAVATKFLHVARRVVELREPDAGG
jgi:hypothetical protein